MDRAHRLGQKKVVNVHRLIMRGTLEEKVMSLQKFKLSVANAVINAENASMKTMNTDQLLDLFATAETSKKVLLAGPIFCLFMPMLISLLIWTNIFLCFSSSLIKFLFIYCSSLFCFLCFIFGLDVNDKF